MCTDIERSFYYSRIIYMSTVDRGPPREQTRWRLRMRVRRALCVFKLWSRVSLEPPVSRLCSSSSPSILTPTTHALSQTVASCYTISASTHISCLPTPNLQSPSGNLSTPVSTAQTLYLFMVARCTILLNLFGINVVSILFLFHFL